MLLVKSRKTVNMKNSWTKENVSFHDNINKPIIDFYVVVTERLSDTIRKDDMLFREKIKQGAFGESISKKDDIIIDLNHEHIIADQCNVFEDKIGLRCIANIMDIDVLAKIVSSKINGCSFTFRCIKDNFKYDKFGTVREVEKLILDNISIIDQEMKPVYDYSSLIHATIPKSMQIDIYERILELTKLERSKVCI